MIKCCNCGSEIKSVKIPHFNYDGSDSDVELPLTECEENAVYFETDRNWCGYELSEEEQKERIECPKCNKYPFKYEVQIDEPVRVIMFKESER